MWSKLPSNQREEYKKMILAFASLTEMFAQKSENDDSSTLSPIINSKYQETVFQRVFNASAEDINNTSFDAALRVIDSAGNEKKYLIGIKTFGIASGLQKIAQFKANHDDFADRINAMRLNSISSDGSAKDKAEIDYLNLELYTDLAKEIATLRNTRIDSSIANLQGFTVEVSSDDVSSVYHVLMPSKKGDIPRIHVGETSYNRIDIDSLQVLGCTGKNHPTNFDFTDGKHTYRYTSADSQLYMNFDNENIVQETWNVQYADDAYAIFKRISDDIFHPEEKKITESYSWKITNEQGDMERFSGFNSFYGVGPKFGMDVRADRINRIYAKYESVIEYETLMQIRSLLQTFLLTQDNSSEGKKLKVGARNSVLQWLTQVDNEEFKTDVMKLLFRPKDEIYIPVKNSKKFHSLHPDFFGKDVGTFSDSNSNKLALSKEQRSFNLVFEPSGDSIRSYICQDAGKAIESCDKQSFLGEWILRGVFQLKEYEPLTVEKLRQVNINGIRLYKTNASEDIHLQFIWIDDDNLPEDFFE